MNKKKIISYLTRKSIYTSEQKQLLSDIDGAMEELKIARQYFEVVNDPKLVDYAIYMEEAAKAKYVYLLNKAKKNDLKIACGSGIQ